MTELICIVCPKGCHLTVDEADGYRVSGYGCKRGEEYGKAELLNPTRVLTSIVRTEGGIHPCCPVKTDKAIPKKEIGAAMELLTKVYLKAPVAAGDVVAEHICGTESSWVATKDMPAIQ